MKYLCIVLLLYFSNAYASNWHNADNFAKLMHYQDGKSLVVSKNFFMHKEGNANIDKEIIELKKSYNKPKTLGDNHPRCLFPDRYFWLSKQVTLKNYNPYPSFCKKLTQWHLKHPVKSASILLVGGYFANPASVFGHNLLRLNSGKSKLFDLTLNFGAKVPQNENSVSYIFKGLFGGYDATFSNKSFYQQDLIYSKNELRDIWEYELELDDDELTLIKLHIWTLKDRLFDYYFLKENCAYQLASILDTVIEMDLPKYKKWYIPAEVITQIHSQKNRIKSIVYKPSSEKIMFERFKKLSPNEQLLTEKIIDGSKTNLTQANENVLDSLLDYYNYKLIKDDTDDKIANKRDKVLIARFKYPPNTKTIVIKNNAPHNYPNLSKLSFSFDKKENFYSEFSIFNNDLLGEHSLLHSELIAPKITFITSKKYTKFYNFDLLKIIKLNKNLINFPEYKFSWEFQAGLKNYDDKIKPTAIAGMGSVIVSNDNNILYVFNSVLLNHAQREISPQVSINFVNKSILGKSLFSYAVDVENDVSYYKYKLQKQMSKNKSLFIEKVNDNLTIGVDFYL